MIKGSVMTSIVQYHLMLEKIKRLDRAIEKREALFSKMGIYSNSKENIKPKFEFLHTKSPCRSQNVRTIRKLQYIGDSSLESIIIKLNFSHNDFN